MNREDIIRMADASGLSLYGMGKDREQFIDYLERFAALVASAEREACAKLCDEFPDVGYIDKKLTSDYHAHLIRQRGQA
jgi:hypothetical protein